MESWRQQRFGDGGFVAGEGNVGPGGGKRRKRTRGKLRAKSRAKSRKKRRRKRRKSRRKSKGRKRRRKNLKKRTKRRRKNLKKQVGGEKPIDEVMRIIRGNPFVMELKDKGFKKRSNNCRGATHLLISELS